MEQEKIEPQVIGFFIQDKNIVVANPCAIPIEMIESTIKEHKKRKDKKDVTHVFCIMLPINFKKILKQKK